MLATQEHIPNWKARRFVSCAPRTKTLRAVEPSLLTSVSVLQGIRGKILIRARYVQRANSRTL
jgi:hypothetical protein